ncbi:hypothetical protein H311_02414 [Anncaliia algerae PRA109]|nr:hypothetical protein H311_02414 [Anncaliia algerae PRA109]
MHFISIIYIIISKASIVSDEFSPYNQKYNPPYNPNYNHNIYKPNNKFIYDKNIYPCLDEFKETNYNVENCINSTKEIIHEYKNKRPVMLKIVDFINEFIVDKVYHFILCLIKNWLRKKNN